MFRRGFSLQEVLLVGAIVGGLVVLGVPKVEREIAFKRSEKLAATAAKIQTAVERYAVDHEGDYPLDANDLIKTGYLAAWPEYPGGRGKLKLIQPGDPWQRASFVYIPSGPIIPASHAQCAPAKMLPENYMLVMYTSRPHVNFAKAIAAHSVGVADSPHIDYQVLDVLCQLSAAERRKIDWQHADVVLSSEANYFVGCI